MKQVQGIEMIHYKVVAVESDGRLGSCCRNSTMPAKFRTTYVPGKIIEPTVRGTKLFVFNDLSTACEWASDTFEIHHTLQVWSCECLGSAPEKLYRPPYVNEMESYWVGRDFERSSHYICGAYLVDTVQLLELRRVISRGVSRVPEQVIALGGQ